MIITPERYSLLTVGDNVLIDTAHHAVGIGVEILEPETVSRGIDALKIHAEAGVTLCLECGESKAQQVLIHAFSTMIRQAERAANVAVVRLPSDKSFSCFYYLQISAKISLIVRRKKP